MLSQRSVLRLSQRAAQQLRASPARNAVQRRFNSSEPKLPWVVDNEFNRERAAVKEHAAATSGELRNISYGSRRLHMYHNASLLIQCLPDLWRKLSI